MSDTTARVGVVIGTKADTAQLDRYSQSVRRMQATIKDLFSSKNVATAGAAFGAGALSVQGMVSRITEAVTGSSELASEMAQVERRVSLAGEAFQVLSRAGKASSEELIAGLAKYRVELGKALAGDKDARKVFADLGQSPEALTKMPLERQLELVGQSLLRFGDKNREAAEAQKLFGRSYSAMVPVLDQLGTQGYDKLRDKVEATAGVLKNELSSALNSAKREASAAQNELSISLAQSNLRLLEMKANVTRFLAGNAGTIQSGGTALAAGFLTASVLSQLSTRIGPQLNVIGSQAAGAFSKGFGVGAALLPGIIADRIGGPAGVSAFAALGRSLATPFGAALAVATGAILIKELERIALERVDRRNALLEGGTAEIGALRDRIKNAASKEDAQKAASDAAALLDTRRKELTALEAKQKGFADAFQRQAARRGDAGDMAVLKELSDEEKATLQRDQQDVAALEKVVAFAKEKGAALAAANAAQRVATDQAFAEAAELEKTRIKRDALEEREKANRYGAMTDDQSKLQFLQQWRAEENASFAEKIAATKNAELRSDYELEKRVKIADIDAKIAQVRQHAADEADRNAKEAEREVNQMLEKLDRERRHQIVRSLDSELAAAAVERAKTEGDFTKTNAEKWGARLQEMDARVAAVNAAMQDMEARKRIAGAMGLPTDQHEGDLQRMRDELAQLDIARSSVGPNPNSWVEQTAAGIASLRDQWGTTAQQIAGGITGTIGTAVDSMAENITQAALVTGDWNKALDNVEMAIGTELVRAILTMGARWVATQIMMAVAGKALAVVATASLTPIAAAQSAIWAAPATLATIASFGGAAAAAPAEIAGATMATQLQALAGYLDGGAAVGRQLAWLSEDGKPEFVFSAPAVENMGGIGAMNDLHQAALNPSSAPAAGAVGGRAKGVRVVTVIDDGSARSAAEIDALASDPRFENHVVRIGRKRRAEIGIQV